MRRFFGGLLFFCLAAAVCTAQVPVRSEQTIWSILAFNGRDYSSTWAPEFEGSIYLLSGKDSFLSLRKSLVYWWPLTAEWKMNPDALFVELPGTLELRDAHGKVTSLPLRKFTYFNTRGEYEQNWTVLTGPAAVEELRRYQELTASYYEATEKYRRANAAYDIQIEKLTGAIARLKAQGLDSTELARQILALHRPDPPQEPTTYVVPPSAPQEAFILNLASGTYSILLRNADGSIMEGSEKRVVVHTRRRSGGIGYEVIPGDKWTRPERSTSPSSVIYLDGSADLYLQPFFEEEYNDLAYEKTVNPTAGGNPNIWKWVRIQQVPRATIETAEEDSARTMVHEMQYSVVPGKGSSLGYTIVPFDPQAVPGKAPDIVAMRVPVSRTWRTISILTRGQGGAILPGGERQIRVVAPMPLSVLFIALAILPLVAMCVVFVRRARLYAGGPKGASPKDG